MQMANDEANAGMQELVDYYREIYGILRVYLAQTKRLVHLEKIDVDALSDLALMVQEKSEWKGYPSADFAERSFYGGDRAMIEYLIESAWQPGGADASGCNP